VELQFKPAIANMQLVGAEIGVWLCTLAAAVMLNCPRKNEDGPTEGSVRLKGCGGPPGMPRHTGGLQRATDAVMEVLLLSSDSCCATEEYGNWQLGPGPSCVTTRGDPSTWQRAPTDSCQPFLL